ncbi:MAG: ATP-binding protein [Colwellia sp.]
MSELASKAEEYGIADLKNRHTPTSSQYTNKNNKPLQVGSTKYPQSIWISIYGSILTAIIIVVFSTTYYYEAKRLFQQIQKQEIELDAKNIAPVVRDTYEHLKGDLTFLSRTPPIEGIIKATENNDLENLEVWRSRLHIIFTEMMKTYQGYHEISYIKLGDTKETLVTIVKNSKNIKEGEVSRKVIQQREGYLDHLEHEELNFEYKHNVSEHKNRIITPYQKELSLTIPIYNDEKELFGAIIMRADLLSQSNIERLSLLGKSIFFMDNTGKIFIRINEESPIVEKSILIQDLYPQLETYIGNNSTFQNVEFTGEHQGYVGLYHTVQMGNEEENEYIRLFIKLNDTKLNRILSTMRNKTILIALSLILLSAIVAFFIARRLLKPLEQISNELVRYGNTGSVRNLPVSLKNEVGVLARSFHNMLLQKEENDLALMQQQKALDEHAIVSISDVHGSILYVNDGFTRVSGYSKEELIGNNHRLINSGHHSREFFKEMFDVIIQGKVWQGEVCNKTKKGELFWERVTVVPFFDALGHPEKYVSIRTEITENKNNQQAVIESRDILSKKVAELEEVNIELNQFAYIASHDLKSPLNGINQIVSWLEEDCKDILPKESREHLLLLRNRATRMIGLLRDLLEYSKVGRSNYDVEKIYLRPFTEKIFTLLGDTEGFTCNAPNVPLIIPKVPFEVVIRNLITNAIKHHNIGQGIIEIEVDQDDHYYFIKVIDDGPGIAKEFQARALEMFQTLQSKDSFDSSGMGLAIVKKTIEHYGGTLSIESDGVKGSCIVFTWPQKPLPEH